MSFSLRPGDPVRLGRYELTERLGEGGQGIVFAGYGPDGVRVAVKLLRGQFAGDAKARQRFVRELGLASRVADFCTARVLEADVEGDQPYIVSEFVPGPSLDGLVRAEGPQSGAALRRLAIGTATALAAIHEAGIVHRDFKPHNVLLSPDGPRVIDFGIARALDGSGTMTSQAIGTPAYMSPEQLAAKDIGPWTDMFAWGATMLFAATGAAPFGEDTVPAIIHRVLYSEPDASVLPSPLDSLVAACLSKDHDQRPSAVQILRSLIGPVVPASAQADPLMAAAATFTGQASFTAPAVPLLFPPEPPGQAPEDPSGGRRPGRRALLLGGLGAAVAAAVPASVYLLADRKPDDAPSRLLGSHAEKVTALAYVQQGKILLSAGEDMTFRVWEVSSGESNVLTQHKSPIRAMAAVAFPPTEGTVVATGDDDGGIRLWAIGRLGDWSLKSTSMARDFTSGHLAVGALAFSPDAEVIASAAGYATSAAKGSELHFHDRFGKTPVGLRPLLTGLGRVFSLAFSPDGKTLAATGTEGIELWDVRQRRKLLQAPSPSILAAASFSPDGTTLATGTGIWTDSDGNVRIWNVKDMQPTSFSCAPDTYVAAVAFAPDGKRLASGGSTVRLWDLATARSTVFAREAYCEAVAVDPSGRTLAASVHDGQIRLYDLTVSRGSAG